MKIVSFNVNGLRSVIKNDTLVNLVNNYQPDILCLQEIKMSCKFNSIIEEILPEYPYKYWIHCASANGRHGVAIFSKIKAIRVSYKVPGLTEIQSQGRYIQAKFKDFYLVCVYVPNSGAKLERLGFRTEVWDNLILKRLNFLKGKSEVILAGDLNVVSLEKDTYNFKQQRNKVAGVTDSERENFKKILDNGFIDAFRSLHPNKIQFSYFTYLFKARQFNKGMLLDYFILTPKIFKKVKEIRFLSNVLGSDHIPVECEIDII